MEQLEELYEEDEEDDSPPEPCLIRRAKSFSDFYEATKSHVAVPSKTRPARKKRATALDALAIFSSDKGLDGHGEFLLDSYQEELLEASQQEYL